MKVGTLIIFISIIFSVVIGALIISFMSTSVIEYFPPYGDLTVQRVSASILSFTIDDPVWGDDANGVPIEECALSFSIDNETIPPTDLVINSMYVHNISARTLMGYGVENAIVLLDDQTYFIIIFNDVNHDSLVNKGDIISIKASSNLDRGFYSLHLLTDIDNDVGCGRFFGCCNIS